MRQGKNIYLLETSFKKGNKDAFKAIYNFYYDKLFDYINSFTNNKELTQDIVQDTFIKVWNSKDNLDSAEHIGGYLYKTAYHTFVDNYRINKKKHKLLDTLAYKNMNELINENDDERAKKISQIKIAIEKLPPRCKEIFLMSKYQGYKYLEIAEHLNLSVKTIESQMGKAFSIIRKEIKDKGLVNLFLYLWNNKQNRSLKR